MNTLTNEYPNIQDIRFSNTLVASAPGLSLKHTDMFC